MERSFVQPHINSCPWHRTVFIFLMFLSATMVCADILPTTTKPNGSSLKGPVALAISDDGQSLFIANKKSGTVSILDTRELTISNESKVGGRLSDMKIVGNTVFVLDRYEHELIVLQHRDLNLNVLSKIRVSHTPVNLVVSYWNGKTMVYVTSLWSHRWTSIDVSDRQRPVIENEVDLEFAPRHQIELPTHDILVCDAFGGRFCVVNPQNGIMKKEGEFQAMSNVAGIAMTNDGKSVVMPHMSLNSEKPTTRFNVHWGDVMLNLVRSVDIEAMLSKQDANQVSEPKFLGYPDSATGDPTGIIVTSKGEQIICFAGIDQVGISDVGVNAFSRVSVGRRPVAMALSKDESTLFVANHLDDSMSVIDMSSKKVRQSIPLGNRGDLSLMQQGERLFYDAKLSSDGWFSCHSCHTDGHSNGGLADTFGDGKSGDAKRVLSLLGVVETGPWAWNGKAKQLKEQVQRSIVTTMHGPPPTDQQVEAIVAFLSTLHPPPSVARARQALDAKILARGQVVFEKQGCVDCHQPGKFTAEDVYDVGLEDSVGGRQFNPPSLLGVSQRFRLFHDNRGKSVRDVIDRWKHPVPAGLSEQEKNDLIQYVLSL